MRGEEIAKGREKGVGGVGATFQVAFGRVGYEESGGGLPHFAAPI